MSTEIQAPRSADIQTLSPMQMIQVAFDAAIKQGSAMEVVNVILEQQKWMIQHGEEEAFNAALKRIQKRLKVIPKRGKNKETNSRFATTEDIDSEIQVLLDEENMTLSFMPAVSDKPDMVLIIGTLALGAFEKQYPLEMPADGKGAKGGGVMSRTHATGAAITYAKRYLKNLIFDLRFNEKDDDGNGASGLAAGHNSEGQCDCRRCGFTAVIAGADDLDELKAQYTAAFREAENINDWVSIEKYFKPAREACKAKLSKGASA